MTPQEMNHRGSADDAAGQITAPCVEGISAPTRSTSGITLIARTSRPRCERSLTSISRVIIEVWSPSAVTAITKDAASG